MREMGARATSQRRRVIGDVFTVSHRSTAVSETRAQACSAVGGYAEVTCQKGPSGMSFVEDLMNIGSYMDALMQGWDGEGEWSEVGGN